MRVQMITALGAGLLLSGCATILEGTSQDITVMVNPPEGTCDVTRKGETLGQIAQGSPTVQVSKSRHNIEMKCASQGFKPANVTVRSSVSPGGVASIVFVDFGAVDYVTGALNSYPEKVSVTLEKADIAAPLPPTEKAPQGPTVKTNKQP